MVSQLWVAAFYLFDTFRHYHVLCTFMHTGFLEDFLPQHVNINLKSVLLGKLCHSINIFKSVKSKSKTHNLGWTGTKIPPTCFGTTNTLFLISKLLLFQTNHTNVQAYQPPNPSKNSDQLPNPTPNNNWFLYSTFQVWGKRFTVYYYPQSLDPISILD